jgi:hypothetical protein
MRYPGTPLRAGSENRAAIRALQERLNTVHAVEGEGTGPLDIDGDFGPETEARVRIFQARAVDHRGNPLDIDGVVGPATWAALFGQRPVTHQAAPSDLLSRAIAIAAAEVGTMEVPLHSNRGPKVDLYVRAGGLNPGAGSYAWCACFLYWVFDTAAGSPAANPMPQAPRHAGVHNLWRAIGACGLYRLAPREARSFPERVHPGMFFFLDHGQGVGHVGIITRIRGATLETVEGNTNNGGSREGIGVFARARPLATIDLGFADVTRPMRP